MDEARDPGAGASVERVASSLDIAALEFLPGAVVAEIGGEVEGDLAALGSGGDLPGVGEVSAGRLGPKLGDGALGGI